MIRGKFTPADYFKITIMGFGIGAFLSCLGAIVLPVLLLRFVPEALKNTYLSLLSFAGLLMAMLTQPIVGLLSDRSRVSWGRRRPFILAGVIFAIFFLPFIGLSKNFSTVLITWCFLQIACNVALGTYQGFIPDLVPGDRRGLASGIKTMMETLGNFALLSVVAVFMDRYSPERTYWLWLALGTVATFLLVPTVVTLLTVKEQPGTANLEKLQFSSLYKSFNIDMGRQPEFIWFLASRALMAIPIGALKAYAVYYIMDVFDVPNPAVVAANVFIAVGIGLIITALFAGTLSDRLGRRSFLIATGFIGALGILFLFLSRSQMHLMLSGAVIGIASGAYLSTSWSYAVHALPQGEAARYLGITNLAWAGGFALAKLNGPIIDYFNTITPNLGYSIMLLIISICFLAGSLILFKIKEVNVRSKGLAVEIKPG
ncbi:MAG: MFS transporter [Dehalococcoidales bacterium]|nr:MFS transporter [Dehalococcoidales bacterium]